MKENEREREIAGTRKPTLRSEFDSAYSDVTVGKSVAVNDAGEENVDVSAEEVNIDAEVDLENADNDKVAPVNRAPTTSEGSASAW